MIRYEYVFEQYGEKAPEDERLPANHIWIDIGRDCRRGVFDHHQFMADSEQQSCAVKMLCDNTNYLEGAQGYIRSCDDTPVIYFHTHIYPDTDSVVAIYMVQSILENSKGEAESIAPISNECRKRLCQYAADIDAGKKKLSVDGTMNFYTYLSKVGEANDYGPDESDSIAGRSEYIIRQGCGVLRLILDSWNDDTPDFDIVDGDIVTLLADDTKEIVRSIRADIEKIHMEDTRNGYKEDKDAGNVSIIYVGVWDKDKKIYRKVKSAIWNKLPAVEDEYCCARDEGCVLTVVPIIAEGRTRTIIALNPYLKESEGLSLRPIAEILETLEQNLEKDEEKTSGRFRRDRSEPRDTDGILAEVPFRVTSDPWYISHKEDILDSPRVWSLIDLETIIKVVKGCESLQSRKYERVILNGDDDSISTNDRADFGEINTLGDLYCLKVMDDVKDGEYVLARIEIAPILLKCTNDFLVDCCQLLLGKGRNSESFGGIYEIDYRNIIYVDNSACIILSAEGFDGEFFDIIPTEHDGSLNVRQIIRKMLYFRKRIIACGNALGAYIKDVPERDPKKTDDLVRINNELASLAVEMQNDEMILDPFEYDIYKHIKESFNIDRQKAAVIEVANLMMENAERIEEREEQKSNKKLERIMTGLSLLAIFSALEDSYSYFGKITHLEQLGEQNVGQWISFTLIGIILIFAIFWGIYSVVRLKKHSAEER